METGGNDHAMLIHDFEIGPRQEGYRAVTARTDRGEIAMRYYEAPGARAGVIWVGGVGGGWDTPARNLYPDLSTQLQGDRVASLRVRFRYPTVLEESVLDVLAGIAYLEDAGIDNVALVGHSFGGAVVIQAAATSEAVRTVITLSTQSYGADAVDELSPRCSTLLLHGANDRVLPACASQYVYRLAGEPKRLRILEGADHGLDRAADEVRSEIVAWLREHLGTDGD